MLIIKVAGGLGNQMFQYALYKELMFQGKKCKMDKLSYLKDSFGRNFCLDIFPNVKIDFCNKAESTFYRTFGKINKSYYLENESVSFDENIFKLENGFISGYFQNEAYFENVKDKVKQDFIFDIRDKDVVTISNNLKKDKNSVSIHIRGNDYLKFNDRYGNICNKEYYKKAIDIMNDKIDNPHFYVFSDDIKYAKELLKETYYTILDKKEPYYDYYDMFLMSSCSHNIIANSSFSFWGSYLNCNKNKIVVCPKKWDNKYKNKKVYCEDWMAI